MDLDPTKLFIEFLFGMVGTGYFIFGKKRGNFVFLGCGIALGLFPYFVDRMWAVLLVGCLLLGTPWVIRGE